MSVRKYLGLLGATLVAMTAIGLWPETGGAVTAGATLFGVVDPQGRVLAGSSVTPKVTYTKPGLYEMEFAFEIFTFQATGNGWFEEVPNPSLIATALDPKNPHRIRVWTYKSWGSPLTPVDARFSFEVRAKK